MSWFLPNSVASLCLVWESPCPSMLLLILFLLGNSSIDCKEGRELKNWYLQSMVLEKTPESPLDSKKVKLVNLKGNQPWILIGRTDAEVEISVFWSSDTDSWLIGKVPDAGKDWGQKKKRVWMVSLMPWTWTWANFRRQWGQRDLACWSPWGHKESDTTEQLNWTDNLK